MTKLKIRAHQYVWLVSCKRELLTQTQATASQVQALPFDILYLVTANCYDDNKTLQALSLTCKGLWEEAVRHLWQSIQIDEPTSYEIMKRAESIAARPRCARYIKNLLVSIAPMDLDTTFPWENPGTRTHRTLHAIETAMSLMDNLVALKLYIGLGGAERAVSSAMSRLVSLASFRLQFFSTSMVIVEELKPFLEAQTEIIYFEVRGGWFSDTAILGQNSILSNPGILPNLKHLTYSARGVEEVVRGRPVQGLNARHVDFASIYPLVSAMNASATPITRLEVEFTDPQRLVRPFLDALTLMGLSDRQQKRDCVLETLEIHARDYSNFDSAEPLDPGFLKIMRCGFPRLQTLSLRGNLIPHAAWKPEQYAGPALRTVRGDDFSLEFLENEGMWVER